MADAAPISAPKPNRSLAIDVVKGIGILEVVLHHALGQGSKSFATKGDKHWIAMRTLAWASNFAIPLFLLLSAMLLAGSFVKKPDVGLFVWRRASRTIWPFVAWSFIYWVLRWRNNPHTFDNLRKLAIELVTGKAAYHLYFMVILIQLSIAVPFVVLAMRNRKMGFATIVLLSVVLQLLFFLLNRVPFLTVTAPGSLITWYVPSLLIGVWIALHREEWPVVWRKNWPVFTAVAVVSGAIFTYQSVRFDLGISPESLSFNSLAVVFRTAASLALLGAGGIIAAAKPGPLLAALGRYSLPIYLVHPAILKFLGGPTITRDFQMLPLPVLWVALIVVALSYLFGWLTALVRLDLPLFGQTLPRKA